jgi:hypothetical protein
MTNKILLFLLLFSSLKTSAQVISNDTVAKRYLLFINGHRGPKHDKETPSNIITKKDPTGYWYHLNDSIIKRFNSSQAIYLDGHHSIKTSMYKNFFHMSSSYLLSRFCWIRHKSSWVINPKVNAEGFFIRMTHGAEAGKNFLISSCNKQKCIKMKDTIDIVCHSFGYAYSIGFINAIKDKVVFGKILILAPESAGYYAADWTMFQEAWQYGTDDTGQANSDPIYLQDGLAPQVQVKGLEVMMPNHGGRIFIPENSKKGFIRSHHLKYWSWFHEIKPNDFGYFSK